jgi:glycine/D-amino acid oxidase-like deaminating enzyme
MHYTFAPEAALAWKSLRYFENWDELVGTGRCGFVRTGFAVVVGAENVAKLRANVAMLRAIGVATDLAEPHELRKLEPEARIDDVALAAVEPRSGYADPVATTEGFAAAARRAGAEFLLNTPIASLATRGGRCSGLTDAGGASHEGGAVCVVAGPWTDPLLAPLGATIGIRAERAQIGFFGRPPALRHGMFIDTIAGSYFRPHGDNLTLAGLGALEPELNVDPDSFEESNDAGFLDAVRARLAQRIPGMKNAPYVRGHAGIYDVSPDSRAVLGAVPTVEGLFVAAGFSGTGFKTAPAVGAAMAELILTGRATTADISAFRFERFRQGRSIRSPNEYAMGAGFGHAL